MNFYVKHGDAFANLGTVKDLKITSANYLATRGIFAKVPVELRDAYIAEQRRTIPSYDNLSRRQSEEVIKLLAEHFKLAPPQLKWNRRTRRGVAHKKGNTISCGPCCWRGLTNSLLHEFAHSLTFQRNPTGSVHGPEFIANLWEIVLVWHDDPRLYAWLQEYPHIAKVSVKMLEQWKTSMHAEHYGFKAAAGAPSTK